MKMDPSSIDYTKIMLTDMFLDYRWKNIVDSDIRIVYQKVEDETSFVEIVRGSNADGVWVSVPVKNTNVQYKTRFDNFEEACLYVEERIDDYEED